MDKKLKSQVTGPISNDAPIITFYSYKGGVGRSMALANLSVILAKRYGLDVVVADWDLEAPGIHHFFEMNDEDIKAGIIDYFYRYKDLLIDTQDKVKQESLYLEPLLMNMPSYVYDSGGRVRLLPAGNLSEFQDYINRVTQFNWDNFYEEWNGGQLIELMRHQLKQLAQVTLIDSRTGITDIGGICTTQLPDIVVLVFAFNDQNVRGIERIAKYLDGRNPIFEKLGRHPEILLLPSRKELGEIELLRYWEHEAAVRLQPYVKSHQIKNRYPDFLTYMRKVSVPYVPHFAYGEKIGAETDEGVELVEPLVDLAQILFPEPHYWAGRSAALGQYDQALQNYQQAAVVYHGQGQYDRALQSFQQALVIYREVGDRAGEGTTLNNIGAVYHARGQYDQALQNYQQALVIYREVGDRAREGAALDNIGAVYQTRGQYDQALQNYQQALVIRREVGDRAGEGVALNNIGEIHRVRGQYDRALENYQQALVIAREVGDRAGEGTTLNNIGAVYHARGQYYQALENYQQALVIHREMGNRLEEGTTLNNIGVVYQIRGQYDQALQNYQQALVIAREVGDRAGEGTTLNNIGLVRQTQEQYDQALENYQQALVIHREVGNRAMEGTTLNNIGEIYRTRERYEQALENYQQALVIYRELGNRTGEEAVLANIKNLSDN
jgi:tetratricopeptide (TPR) repeat protein